MTIVCGVDEAGLGPLLGPLVYGYSAFRVPAASPEEDFDLWGALDKIVCREVRQDAERIVVDDSKKVFARNRRGERRLETTALAFLAQLDGDRLPPADSNWMFAAPLRPARELLERHPWYEALPDRLPRHVDAGALELRADRLGRELRAANVELLGAGVRVVPAGELNASYDRTQSKATTTWQILVEVLRHLWMRFAEEGALVVADQQGSRSNYGKALATAFPEAEVRLVEKASDHRLYELLGERRPGGPEPRILLRVAPKADLHSFPTALGSCLAKYARETCMGAFNAWFTELQPGLKPTAGYTTDGRRWVREAAPALKRAHLPPRILQRER